MEKMKKVLKEALCEISPSSKELAEIKKMLHEFLPNLKKRVGADVFVGGSFAKGTLIKKERYDIDIFVRFESGEELSERVARALKGLVDYEVLKGSRDYFRVRASEKIYFEIVPVKKISRPSQAENVTDLSYFHVKYLKKKIKSKKVLDQIKLAKAFCYANGCYGAESYIKGFSGYSLELLLCYYKTFEKFLKQLSEVKDKLIIDIEKLYKNKSLVMMDLNSSKLESPIILIDPTFKQRNALACLSEQTFREFQKVAKRFLRNPSLSYFRKKEINYQKIKNQFVKSGCDYVLLKIRTNKPKGDIAGTKLMKFYRHLLKELEKYFEIKKSGFSYDGENSALAYLGAKSKKEIVVQGPFVRDKENLLKFRQAHGETFVKGGRIFAKEKVGFSLGEFLKEWKKKNAKKMRDMSISGLKIEDESYSH